MAKRATIVPVLRRSKELSDNKHPICIRITKDRKQRYRSIEGLSCSPSYWNENRNEIRRSHPREKDWNKIIRDKVNEFEKIQDRLIEQGIEITAQKIIDAYDRPKGSISVLDFFEERAKELEQKGKYSNAQNYRNIGKQLQNFLKKERKEGIEFSELTYQLLNKWETYLRGERQVKETTLYNYFKTLCALFNEAARRGYAPEKDTPFSDFKISKFNTETEKRAISIEAFRAIEDLNVEGDNPSIIEAHKYMIFSFYAGGMNLTDMAQLKWSDIDSDGEMIKYRRQKTKRIMAAVITPEMQEVIDYFYPLTQSKDHIFPILDAHFHITPRQQVDRIDKVRSRTNAALKELARRAGIQQDITMYTFRHTHASNLRDVTNNMAAIQKSLGHKTQKETETYLAEISDKELKDEIFKLSRKSKDKDSSENNP